MESKLLKSFSNEYYEAFYLVIIRKFGFNYMMKKIKELWKNSKTKKFADPQQNDRPNSADPTRKKS